MKAWILTIARNIYLSEQRTAKRHGDSLDRWSYAQTSGQAPLLAEQVLMAKERQQLGEEIRRTHVPQLSQPLRVAIELSMMKTATDIPKKRDKRAADDTPTYDAMAVNLGVKIGTIKSRISRARKALRDLVKDTDLKQTFDAYFPQNITSRKAE